MDYATECSTRYDAHMDDGISNQIGEYRTTAQVLGDAALEAVRRGDAGAARAAARQSAQYARLVVQLETGEKQFEPKENSGLNAQTTRVVH